jgi:large subunit ribosomal protein L1
MKKVKIDRTKSDMHEPKTLIDAINMLKEKGSTKFDESIDLDIPLKINPKKNENIRGTFELVHGIKKNIKIAVIAETDKVKEAQEMGITVAGGEDLVEQILREGLNVDVCLCTPEMFPKITKLARILGPLKLMPNKKDNTVTNHIKQSIESLISGKSKTVRNDSAGHIRLSVGKKSFSSEQVAENIRACIEFIKANKPEKTKELFARKFFISSTQGISIGCPIGIK